MRTAKDPEQALIEFSGRAANYVAEMYQVECGQPVSPAVIQTLDEAIWEALTGGDLAATPDQPVPR